MKRIVLIVALLLPLPVAAQESPPDEEGPSLMERGAQLFFRGLAEEMDPALRGLRDFAEEAGPAMQSFMAEMGPALVDLFETVKDFSAYHPPEILPNGDIILRRKAEEPPLDLPEPGPNGEVEL
ncbi:hypothetical protein [Pseudooceanicola sp.]|uniref:hypothetical protein n=1 Tax=Pseudooceanicola sp. TaxID=1914328 RepID=UPI0035C72697